MGFWNLIFLFYFIRILFKLVFLILRKKKWGDDVYDRDVKREVKGVCMVEMWGEKVIMNIDLSGVMLEVVKFVIEMVSIGGG